MKRLGKVWTFLVYLFLYAPMIVLFVGSFNDGKDLSEFEGFTLSNYLDLFTDSGALGLLLNSVILGLASAALATLLGTVAAVGIHAMRGRIRRLVMTLTNIPLVNPEIVTGISLALLFVFIGRGILGTDNVLGFGTLLIAHVTFNLPYVILSVMPKLRQTDPSLMDAAQDLGCNVWQILWRVLVPLTGPGIATGITQVFVPSVSTFIISRMLGGGSNLLIGDLIELQFLGNSYNLNLGSAMSLVLMVIVLLCMSFTSSFDESEMEGVM